MFENLVSEKFERQLTFSKDDYRFFRHFVYTFPHAEESIRSFVSGRDGINQMGLAALWKYGEQIETRFSTSP